MDARIINYITDFKPCQNCDASCPENEAKTCGHYEAWRDALRAINEGGKKG